MNSDRLITDREAALLTGLSRAWFQRARWAGGGPKYVKINRAVRYKLSDLDAYLEMRKRSSTSAEDGEDGNG